MGKKPKEKNTLAMMAIIISVIALVFSLLMVVAIGAPQSPKVFYNFPFGDECENELSEDTSSTIQVDLNNYGEVPTYFIVFIKGENIKIMGKKKNQTNEANISITLAPITKREASPRKFNIRILNESVETASYSLGYTYQKYRFDFIPQVWEEKTEIIANCKYEYSEGYAWNWRLVEFNT